MQAERLSFDTSVQIQQFYRWVTNNSLTANEISLWHALMHISSEAGYLVWLSIPITKLERLTGMKKDAIYKARESLEKKGRISVEEGRGSRAAQYRLILFPESMEYEEYVELIEPVEQTEEPPVEIEVVEQQPPVAPPSSPVTIFARIQHLIPMPSPMDIHTIKEYLSDGMEDKLLVEAISIAENELAGKAPTEKWKYAKGIMRNWFNNGIKTFEGYLTHERERRESMENGSNRQGDRPLRTERTESREEQESSGIRGFRIPDQG